MSYVFQVGLFQTTFVLGVELVGPSKRVLCGVVIEYFFVAGELYLALTAWYFRQWRRILLANVLPGILFLSYIVLLPESVRWLITNKKYPEALKTLETVAKRNNVELPSERDLVSFKKRSEASPQTSESMTDLLRRPVLACRLLIVFLCWFVITMIYYGLSMNASSLAGDVYVNFALLSLCEIPGYTLSYVGMSWLGRKTSLSSSLLVGGLACLISRWLQAVSIFLSNYSRFPLQPDSPVFCGVNILLPARQVWGHSRVRDCLPLHGRALPHPGPERVCGAQLHGGQVRQCDTSMASAPDCLLDTGLAPSCPRISGHWPPSRVWPGCPWRCLLGLGC